MGDGSPASNVITTKHMAKNISTLQINGKHKKVTNDLINLAIVENQTDIILIQEPYINQRLGRIPGGVPGNYAQYQHGSNALAAILVKKRFSPLSSGTLFLGHFDSSHCGNGGRPYPLCEPILSPERRTRPRNIYNCLGRMEEEPPKNYSRSRHKRSLVSSWL